MFQNLRAGFISAPDWTELFLIPLSEVVHGSFVTVIYGARGSEQRKDQFIS